MSGSGFAQFIPLILIFVIFYFFLIRPQQKKVKDHKLMVAALKRGDEVVTSGGIVGQIEMSAADAQNAKPHLRTAVKFVSKAPFYVEAVSSGESPTRDMPYDIIYNTVALIGDMQCAVVYDDRTKTVLWAKETY